MNKIVLLIKSKKKETIEISFRLLKERYPQINNYNFIFYNRSKDETMVPTGINENITISSVYKPSELKEALKNCIAISVTGLPQEDFAVLTPVLIQMNKLAIFSLTKDSEGNSIMLNLVDEGTPLLKLRKDIIKRTLLLQGILFLILCGFGINLIIPILPKLEDPTIALYSNYIGLILSASGLFKMAIPKLG